MSTSMAYHEEVDSVSDADRTATALSDLPRETLCPLLEGARARGLADAFELIGVPAVLIDMEGAVLHVGAGAAARMGASIAVAGRHLVGADPASNRAVQDVIAAALAGETKTVELELVGAAGGFCMRAVPMPSGWENPYQLMKAVIVFSNAPKMIDERASAD
jgi:hypothetical protein